MQVVRRHRFLRHLGSATQLTAFLLLLAATVGVPCSAQIKIVAREPAILLAGRGSQRVVITNDGKVPLTLALTTGDFYDDTSTAQIAGPKVSFVLDGGGPLPATLGAGQTIQAIARFDGFAGSLAAHARVFNQGVAVENLRLVEVDTPLNLVLDGAGSDADPIAFSYKRSATITLKNNGKDYVRVDWKFLIGGTVEGSGKASLVPGGLARLVFTPTKDVYSTVDFLKPSRVNGLLLLRPDTPQGVDTSLFNLQPLPVSLSMDRLGPQTTQVSFAMYVMVLLLIGGILSLLSNSILPNIQKRLDYEKQVISLGDRTSTVSNRVDSYLRVLLRLQRNQIDRALADVRWYSLSSGARIDAVAAAVDALDKRLGVAETLDKLRRDLEAASAWAPPSAVDQIDQVLESAGWRLHAVELNDDDVAAANAQVGIARVKIDALHDSAAQAKQVSDNFKQIKTRLNLFPLEYYPDLITALPGIFQVFTQPFENPVNVVQPMLFAVDHAITAGQVALDYAMVRATIARTGSQACDTAGDEARKRLLDRECELINLLATISWKALRAANLLVQQMRENIYEADVIAEIEEHRTDQQHLVRIAYDTLRVRPFMPVYFSLAFDDPRFSNAAALRSLVFRWNFPGDLHEEGATVCHYFTGCEANIHAGAQSAAQGRPARKKSDGGGSVPVSVEVHVPGSPGVSAQLTEEVRLNREAKVSSHTSVEVVRFLLAFSVALVVLEAGIIDQLRKLDFLAATVAVVALGFGADSVKNLLTQNPKKAT